ncbi:uncharacterized protein LOC109852589 [Pseudomyrmex gracilis]|uniref:uncharacterized protein LOC109852589 n=1 Tax=Pseudomyrmex gracilis TaxID=219809 RepID=UPI000994F946|nr:uncharacterized protein LOC109852589 [Pseudomyrmex gracilis]XP_020279463.1 uncharacterized protein LOC109852589 [Pseudomyrmex gracilis]XP_020279471.1 uncharacterized protein LOC109852589 [Pseudomyrmex gracilis]XP_020279481.1 uncharacterized protein LOC109852589 [Pseudomyrmex gracilis]
MKRGTKCIAQTINLSNPQTCVRPKIQKFVNANGDVFDSTRNNKTSWTSPRSVAVKICSLKDIKDRKCSPKMIDSCEKSMPVTSGKKLFRIAMFLVKGAVVVSLVYWTYSEGLWSGSSQTENLYHRIMSIFDPSRSEQLPHLEDMKYSLLEIYNEMVMKVMHVIVNVPREIYRRINEILSSCDTTRKNETK